MPVISAPVAQQSGTNFNLTGNSAAVRSIFRGHLTGNDLIAWAVDLLSPILTSFETALTAAVAGLDNKASVDVATTAAIGGLVYTPGAGASARGRLTACPDNLDAINPLVAGMRVLVKDEAAGVGAAAHGIYTVTTVGTGADGVWDRATDFDADVEVTSGAATFVETGTVNAGRRYFVTTADPIVIGGSAGTAFTWSIYSALEQMTAGDGIDLTGQTVTVDLLAAGGLAFTAGELGVTADVTTGGNVLPASVVTNGVGMDMATTVAGSPTLETDGSGILRVANGGLGTGLTGGGASAIDVDSNILNRMRRANIGAPGAEAADVIPITISVENFSGGGESEAISMIVQVSDSQYMDTDAATSTLSLTGGGDGAINAGSGSAEIHCTTAAGSGTIDLDIAEAGAKTVYISARTAHPLAGDSLQFVTILRDPKVAATFV